VRCSDQPRHRQGPAAVPEAAAIEPPPGSHDSGSYSARHALAALSHGSDSARHHAAHKPPQAKPCPAVERMSSSNGRPLPPHNVSVEPGAWSPAMASFFFSSTHPPAHLPGCWHKYPQLRDAPPVRKGSPTALISHLTSSARQTVSHEEG
jgi:hypothetical protein